MTSAAVSFITEPVRKTSEKPTASAGGFFAPFDTEKETAQQVTRLAARLNASAVSDEEHKSLLAERQALLDKHFDGTITRKETVRLQYVRWGLDRIEDAKNGAWLDKLETRIGEIQKLAEHLKNLEAKLQRASAGKQGRPQHRR